MPTLSLTEAGQGSPLVLIHAFPLDRGMWQAQVDAFADRYRMLTPDIFGFGTSPLQEEGWTMESMADALAETLDERGIRDGVILGGLSMGGYISLAFAKRYPERLRGLILADTRADADTAEMKTTRNETIEFVKGSSAAALVTSSDRWRRPGLKERPVEGRHDSLRHTRPTIKVEGISDRHYVIEHGQVVEGDLSPAGSWRTETDCEADVLRLAWLADQAAELNPTRLSVDMAGQCWMALPQPGLGVLVVCGPDQMTAARAAGSWRARVS